MLRYFSSIVIEKISLCLFPRASSFTGAYFFSSVVWPGGCCSGGSWGSQVLQFDEIMVITKFNEMFHEIPILWILSRQKESAEVLDRWSHGSGTCWTYTSRLLNTVYILLFFLNFQKRYRQL